MKILEFQLADECRREDLKLLSLEEKNRAAAFQFDVHRGRFISCRAMVRRVLAERVGCSPERLEFGYGAYGKPYLREFSEVHFSISHSENRAALALAEFEVGIDIEVERKLEDLDLLAEQCLNGEEKKVVAGCRPIEASRLFLKFWTRKEAVLKALGIGLSYQLDKINASKANVQIESGGILRQVTWSGIKAGPGIVAAVAQVVRGSTHPSPQDHAAKLDLQLLEAKSPRNPKCKVEMRELSARLSQHELPVP